MCSSSPSLASIFVLCPHRLFRSVDWADGGEAAAVEGYERKSVERGGKGMAAKDKQKDRRETDKGGKRQDRGERERGPILPSSLPPVFPSLRQFPSVNSIIYRYTPRRFLLFPPLPPDYQSPTTLQPHRRPSAPLTLSRARTPASPPTCRFSEPSTYTRACTGEG